MYRSLPFSSYTFRLGDSRVECSEKYIRHKFPQLPVWGGIVAPRDRLGGFGDL